MFEPKKILVGTDFSEPARSALDAATDLARRFGAELTLVHVVPLSTYADFAGVEIRLGLDAVQLQAEVHRGAERSLRREVDRLRALGLRCDAVVLDGPAAPGVCELAKARGAELIVVGSHGRTGISRVLIGSVAENVVRHASAPVLVFR